MYDVIGAILLPIRSGNNDKLAWNFKSNPKFCMNLTYSLIIDYVDPILKVIWK